MSRKPPRRNGSLSTPRRLCGEDNRGQPYRHHDRTESLILLLVAGFLCRNLIKIIRPPLHHFLLFEQVFSVVIGTSHIIALDMGQLTLENRLVPSSIVDAVCRKACPVVRLW